MLGVASAGAASDTPAWDEIACEPLEELGEEIMFARQQGASTSLLIEKGEAWIPRDSILVQETRALIREIVKFTERVPRVKDFQERKRVSEDFGDTLSSMCEG